MAGINGSDSDAFLSSNVLRLPTNEIRVDDWSWLVWPAVGVFTWFFA